MRRARTGWRFTERGLALVMLTGVLIATASLVVIGLTAVRVTSSGYHPGTAEQLQLLSPEAGSR